MAQPRTTKLENIKLQISQKTLQQYMYENRDVWLSSTEIARVFNIHAKHVRVHMKPLVEAGLIDGKVTESVAIWRYRTPDATHLAWQQFTRQPRSQYIQQRAA